LNLRTSGPQDLRTPGPQDPKTFMAPAKTQAALVGGVAMGVLSALPVINFANCCCAWILFGGALAAYLMQQNHPEPITIGDGAIVGLLAGLIGGFVGAIVSIPISMAMGPLQAGLARDVLSNPDLPPEFRRLFEEFGAGAVIGVGFIFFFFLSLVVSTVFGMIGGLFGALMFRKQPPVIPPPIPPTVF
jgi:ribose/xylose/arabinose/galactoside ABC-type transport system permease subunit